MSNVIKTEDKYEDALERVHALMQLDLAEDSPESDELDVLASLVEDYERRHYPTG